MSLHTSRRQTPLAWRASARRFRCAAGARENALVKLLRGEDRADPRPAAD